MDYECVFDGFCFLCEDAALTYEIVSFRRGSGGHPSDALLQELLAQVVGLTARLDAMQASAMQASGGLLPAAV